MKPYLNEYSVHKANAKDRGIEFLLTYKEWYQIWFDSGHLHERGKGKLKYCMARFNDTGPYALGNVKIITNSENLSEGNLGKIVSEETKKLMSTTNIRVISQKQKEATSAFHKGKKLSKEHAKALRDSNLGKKRPPFSEEWRKNQSISAKARCARQKAEKEKARNEDQVRAQSKSK